MVEFANHWVNCSRTLALPGVDSGISSRKTESYDSGTVSGPLVIKLIGRQDMRQRHGPWGLLGLICAGTIAMPLYALELDGVREIRMETEGRLHVSQGSEASVVANRKVVTFERRGDTLLIRSAEAAPEAQVDEPTDLQISVVVANLNALVSTSDAHLTVDRFEVDELNLTLAGHGGINVNNVVADEVNISLAGHGSVSVDNLRAENVDARLRGHGSVQIDGLDTGSLAVHISGHGSVEVSGSARTQMLDVHGQGDYFADDLQSDVATVAIRGRGRAHLWVRSALTVDEMQEGTVRYRGAPVLHYLGADQHDAGSTLL